jgi:putative hemolysin
LENIDPGDPHSIGSFINSLNLFSHFSLGYLASTITITILLLVSALLSGAEVAFFSLSKEHVQRYRQSNSRAEKLIFDLLQHPRRLLATILIMNTMVNLAIISVSGYLAWILLEPISSLQVILLTLLIASGIIFFGEVLPKVYAMPHNQDFALYTAPFFQASGSIFRPLSWLMLTLTRLIEGRLHQRTFYTSPEGLQQSIDMVINQESSAEEQVLLKGIVSFSSVSVTEIMRSRLDITALDASTPLPDVIDNIREWGYSRIPVYHESIDKIEGILYIKDLLPHLEAGPSFAWPKLVRPPFFVPESKMINDLLRDFQELRVHMAIVVDEYGGTSGLVTLEDIIEEIVGDISDEFDVDEDVVYSQIDENTFIFEGKTLLHDFCRIMSITSDIFDPVKGESESVGGLMLELFSRIPRTGEQIAFDRFKFVIDSADNKKIKRVKVHVVHFEENIRKNG